MCVLKLTSEISSLLFPFILHALVLQSSGHCHTAAVVLQLPFVISTFFCYNLFKVCFVKLFYMSVTIRVYTLIIICIH